MHLKVILLTFTSAAMAVSVTMLEDRAPLDCMFRKPITNARSVSCYRRL